MHPVVEAVVGDEIGLGGLRPSSADHLIDMHENVFFAVILITFKAIQVVCVIHIISGNGIITREADGCSWPDVDVTRSAVKKLKFQHDFIQMSLTRSTLGCAYVVDGLVVAIPPYNFRHLTPPYCDTNGFFVDERNQSDLPEVTELSI